MEQAKLLANVELTEVDIRRGQITLVLMDRRKKCKSQETPPNVQHIAGSRPSREPASSPPSRGIKRSAGSSHKAPRQARKRAVCYLQHNGLGRGRAALEGPKNACHACWRGQPDQNGKIPTRGDGHAGSNPKLLNHN
ncbi:hypothetical protein WJX84_011943 [Apatococcus fuscideae]|uniref:Uncharacterized protein n=1 Tax=Apatococcus fuscideae TaxID=2026836 RepID=A0AAW1SQK8_9CHLO